MRKCKNSLHQIKFYSCLAVLFYLIAALVTPSTYGMGKVWVACKEIEGGTIFALAIDPQNTATVFAGSMGNGVFKLISRQSWDTDADGKSDLTV